MMARLVAVDISSDQAVLGDVFVVSVGIFRKIVVEEFVQGRDESLLAAHQGHDSVDVLRSMEGEIQRVAFDEAFAYGLHDVEILLESAVGVLRAAETEFGVEDIGVVACTGGIFFGGLGITCQAGGVPDRPVVVGIFKRIAGGCGDVVIRDVTEFHVVPQATVPLLFRGRDHGFQSSLPVNVQPLGNGVGQDGYCMVAAHAPVFVGHVAPDR